MTLLAHYSSPGFIVSWLGPCDFFGLKKLIGLGIHLASLHSTLLSSPRRPLKKAPYPERREEGAEHGASTTRTQCRQRSENAMPRTQRENSSKTSRGRAAMQVMFLIRAYRGLHGTVAPGSTSTCCPLSALLRKALLDALVHSCQVTHTCLYVCVIVSKHPCIYI